MRQDDSRDAGDPPDEGAASRPLGAAFLLAQVGALAAERFRDRVSALDIAPPQAGVLRVVASQPGRSQQAVARELGIAPSKLVALVDDLESRSLLRRRRSETDRRQYALELTPRGRRLMERLSAVAREHERDLTSALSADERRRLVEMLSRMAAAHGLREGVHPGYRTL